MRLWIDTDVGDDPDDAVALLCAAAHPGLDVIGVSTVDGDHRRRVTEARALVDAPVVAGDDPSLVASIAGAAPDALLAIGPLTNVAAVLGADAVPPRLAIMGGALGPVHHRGEEQRVEHNFGRDPTAARRVLAGVADALLVPLDVTARMVVDDAALARLFTAAPVLREPVDDWLAGQEPGARLCLHDPLALLALLGEPVVTTKSLHLAIDATGRVVEEPAAPAMDVVVAADVDQAIERIVELLELA